VLLENLRELTERQTTAAIAYRTGLCPIESLATDHDETARRAALADEFATMVHGCCFSTTYGRMHVQTTKLPSMCPIAPGVHGFSKPFSYTAS
jgi:hypothetical protein